MIADTGAILTAAAADEDDGVLLDVVALAGDVGGDHAAGGEADTGGLALARVGLLGARDADLEADAFLLRAVHVGQRGGDGVAGSLRFAASS